MLDAAIARLKGPTRQAICLPAPARRLWQRWVVVANMLALVAMLAAAVAHVHASGAANDDNCPACNLAFDTLDAIALAPVVMDTPAATHYYYVFLFTSPTPAHISTPCVAAGCGPPAASRRSA